MPSPKSILHLTRAFIRDQHLRRTLMFYCSLGSMLMLFIGAVLIDTALRTRPALFVTWWAACTWLMLSSLLLAIFDLLLIRAAARRERRELAKRIFKERPPNENTN